LDKFDKLPRKEVKENLNKYCAEQLLKIVEQPEDYFKKYKAYQEILELKKYCSYYGIKIVFQPTLARGLSYYTGNVFEIKSNIKETICAGGTYPVGNVTATGISFSIERLMAVSNILIDIEKILVVSLNKDKEAIAISRKLRQQGKNVSVFFGKPNKAFDYAKTYNLKKIIFVGEKECEKKKYMIKDLQTGKEVLLVVEKKK